MDTSPRTENNSQTGQFRNQRTVTIARARETVRNQELEAHYMYMAKIQEVLTAESEPKFDSEPLEKTR
ncbi:hypothetical protein Tco_1199770 [Tanacetum coccineum]